MQVRRAMMWSILVLIVAVSAKKCPSHSGPKPQSCGANETYAKCKTICPPQSCIISLTADYACDKPIPCTPGCDCIKNHLRNADGRCVLKDDCPSPPQATPCGPNEKEVKCKTICPPQNCDISYTSYTCASNIKCERGCDCIENYLRGPDGVCVLNDDCPPPPQATPCGPNEKEVGCKTICPPQSCDISYTSYTCASDIKCERGCDCIENYLRGPDGVCVLNDDCPPPPQASTCGPNEKEVECKTTCPPQSCDIAYTEYLCSDNITCTPGCDCIDNHLRNPEGECIPSDQCPPRSTVDESTKPPVKASSKPPSTKPSKTKSPSSSTASSSSSSHSETKSSSSSSSTSSASSQSSSYSKCQKPQSCGANETLVECKTVCPPQSCAIAYTDYDCRNPPPCTSGCDCIKNHLRNSDGVCILNDDCPPHTG